MTIDSKDLDHDAAFAALADPTRRAILSRLADGEATVNELAEPFDISQPAISRHLKVLEGAGLITRRVDGQRRPCRLAGGTLEELEAWLDMLRRALTANYNRLDAVLADEMAKQDLKKD
ncbi:ArsR/SmtB family transcription factor [Maritimibacter dapengensis]|uniref:Metalloregulator ArsR/SmtB family transcription factor n=1 Tax=Maritimibacter dapengensis TaxID=2836868 RepID=A0ABS6SWZ7_9RHOB|nr:metalloregulator ArsR/SmtB family transcription factor [Maritimibacter dapengensis]MBV7377482.1 metalloregulator ArsR/SmtB family transcription factor [Maritimibacter dapengensis]